MPVNNEALDVMHNLAKKEGYTKDITEFSKLLSTNDEALKTMHTLAKKEGYQKDINEFSNLLGIEKKKPTSNGSQAGSEGGSLLTQGSYTTQPKKDITGYAIDKIKEVTPKEKNNATLAQKAKEEDTFSNSLSRGAERLKVSLLSAPEDFKNAVDVLETGALKAIGIDLTGLQKQVIDFNEKHKDVIIKTPSQVLANEANKLRTIVDAKSQVAQSNRQGGITDNLLAGNYGKATEYAAKTFLESLPQSLAMANIYTGLAVSASTVGDEMRDTQANGEQPSPKTVLAGTLKAGLEFLFERNLGTGAVTQSIIKRLGKEGAEKAVRKMAEHTFLNSLGAKIAKGVGTEGASEGATRFGQNAVDILINKKKDVNYTDGVSDDALVGMFGGGTHGAIATSMLHTIESKQQPQVTQSDANLMSDEAMQQAGVESNLPQSNNNQNAVQEPSTSSENAPVGETGENQAIDNQGVRPSEQGNEVAEPRSQEEVAQEPHIAEHIANGIDQAEKEGAKFSIEGQEVHVGAITNESIEINGTEQPLEVAEQIEVHAPDGNVMSLQDVVEAHIEQQAQEDEDVNINEHEVGNYSKRNGEWYRTLIDGTEEKVLDLNNPRTLDSNLDTDPSYKKAKEDLKSLTESENLLDGGDGKLNQKQRDEIKSRERPTIKSMVLGYFADGGKVKWGGKKHGAVNLTSGKANREQQSLVRFLSSEAPSIEVIAEKIHEANNGHENDLDTQEIRNEIETFLGGDTSKLFNELNRATSTGVNETELAQINEAKGNVEEVITDIEHHYERAKEQYANEKRVYRSEKGGNTATKQETIKVIRENGDNSESKQIIKDINKSTLTHAEGLGKLKGAYLSTKKDSNRYKLKDKPVTVKIKNPLKISQNQFLDIQKTAIQEYFNKDSIEDLSNADIDLLAELLTADLHDLGYDSVYFEETGTQEGELIVFNKKNVIFNETQTDSQTKTNENAPVQSEGNTDNPQNNRDNNPVDLATFEKLIEVGGRNTKADPKAVKIARYISSIAEDLGYKPKDC